MDITSTISTITALYPMSVFNQPQSLTMRPVIQVASPPLTLVALTTFQNNLAT